MLEEYTTYLTKVRKKNGMKLMESTIDTYSDFIRHYITLFEERKNNHIILLEKMNQILILRSNSIILYSAFRYYLGFIGIDLDDRTAIHMQLRRPKNIAVPIRNIQLLQQKILSKKDLRFFLEKESDDYNKLAFNMLYDTACRRSELLNITFRDIRPLDPKKPDEKEMIDKGTYAIIRVLGKGGKKRFVSIQKSSFFLLIKIFGLRWRNKDKVFAYYKANGELYKDQEHQLYLRLTKSSKYFLGKAIHPHAFRHQKLTDLASNNTPLVFIQRYAGHDSIKTTEIYLHIADEDTVKAISNYSEDMMEKKR